MDIFTSLQNYANLNFMVDVEDKLPIFVCSIGAHLFNSMNKCSMCDFDPDLVDDGGFAIEKCPMRHSNPPFYTPMGHVADTRIHILMRGVKGSGKTALIDMFLNAGTGIIWSPKASRGEGFRTMIGPNSITEAGMFGSVDEEGQVVGRPLAREMCGGFLGFEEFSSVIDAGKKDHSIDMKNQLLTSTDSGRVMKGMRSGWVQYSTRYTIWAGTQPGRFELESGLDRRFFIIDINMNPEKELLYKQAGQKMTNMSADRRQRANKLRFAMREWFTDRQLSAMLNPPAQTRFGDDVREWLERSEVRSFEADLYRRLMIGYWVMQEDYNPDPVLEISIDERLSTILEDALRMRRTVMDADLQLIKTTFWLRDLPKSTLVKEVSRMVTMGDYQTAKRWIEESLVPQEWYHEFKADKEGRGRKGVVCRIGYEPPPIKEKKELNWGEWKRGV
jgi:hypothetical protein